MFTQTRADANTSIANANTERLGFGKVLRCDEGASCAAGVLKHIPHQFANYVTYRFHLSGCRMEERNHLNDESCKVFGSRDSLDGNEAACGLMGADAAAGVDPDMIK